MIQQIFGLLLALSLNSPSSGETIVELIEEAAPGTVVIDNLQHRFQLPSSANSQPPYVAIGNPSSPGIDTLTLKQNRFDGALQLVVKDGHRGPDREQLCDSRHIETTVPSPGCDIPLVILYGDRQNPSYAKITLRIFDVNDNAPMFDTNDQFEVRIPEDAGPTDTLEKIPAYKAYNRIEKVGNSIPLPIAYDNDLPPNGVKSYRLTSVLGQEMDDPLVVLVNNGTDIPHTSRYTADYEIIHTPALKVIRPLDREKKSDYWFHLLAIDGGNPQRTGTLTIHLRLTDLNDNAPKFSKPIYHQPTFTINPDSYDRTLRTEVVRIPETIAVGSNIVTLTTEDADEGQNAEMNYRIREPLNNERDMAVHRSFTLIRSNQSVTLKTVKPLDADNQHGKLWIDNNGELFGTMLQLTVEAVDSGVPPFSTSITIHLLLENVNDNQPEIAVQFTNPLPAVVYGKVNNQTNWIGSLKENQLGPITIAHLTVTDKDLIQQPTRESVQCETNDTRFALEKLPSLSSSGTEDQSRVTSTTQSLYFYRMFATKPVDREEQEWVYVHIACLDNMSPINTQYGNLRHLNTYASSIQLTGTVVVSLKILDINDNAPKFQRDTYEFSVPETSSNPSIYLTKFVPDDNRITVGQVQALDADSGKNSEVEYRLIANSHEAFQLDMKKGTLWRVGTLDREKEAEVELRIEARDLGLPQLSSTCIVKIEILDVNDHAPYWITTIADEDMAGHHLGRSEDGVFYFSISEDMEIGQTIGSIRAVDIDGLIDSEPIQLNQGELPYALQRSVKKKLNNMDTKLTYNLESVEDAMAFSINKHTGELRLSRKLDRETRAHYELRAFAVDSPSPRIITKNRQIHHWDTVPKHRFTATATIIITVLDVNDNVPQFETPLAGQEFHMEPGSPLFTPGTTLFTAKAHDADHGENATVRYALEGDGYGIVEIDATTGMCYVREPMHRNKLIKLLEANKLPLTEHIQKVNYKQFPSSTDQKTQLKHPSEMRSIALSLVVVAYDLGRPTQLNSSRMVQLVWNGENTKDLHTIYSKTANLGVDYGHTMWFGGKPNGTERLLIPLVVGAVVLLIIVFLILFSVARYRKQTNTRLSNTFQGTSRTKQRKPGNNPQLEQIPTWKWCTCINSDIRKTDELTHPDSVDSAVQERSGKITSSIVVSTPAGEYKAKFGTQDRGERCKTAMDFAAPRSAQSYLPDCIPTSELEMAETIERSQIGHLLVTPSKLYPNTSEWKLNRARYNGSTLSRAYSEESLRISRPSDVGYTALCAYPSMNPENPLCHPSKLNTTLTEMYYNGQHRPDHAQFAPYAYHRPQCVSVNPETRIPTAAIRGPSASFYSPLSVVTSQFPYPTFRPAEYALSPTEPDNVSYEHYELEEPTDGTDGTKSKAHSGSGWKPKLSDAYAENTFV
ncbi:hypothetical protein T265_13176 [Opisthorchis viverrini]|uniref:Cadherin domain-containing protein n=1 Tax=Opisthorchis viverrini TaxID=6198 RepID=A0A074ZWY9_OPIVI|nr:hypothetical protein T265_13176 [Opisthorchis viverrini]KER30447.1 hypothetical protein T265_13176 [Opisthorchis viverrini]